MINGLKPYPKYKEGLVPGLGAVPEHWTQPRAKYLFREVDERSTSGDEELLSVSHKTGVTPRSQKTVTMFLAESNVGHKICRPDDVVVNTMWAWMAALGVSKHTGLVSPSYGVYRPRKGNTLQFKYVDELLRTEAYRAEYTRRSTGVNSSRLRLYPDQFLKIPILVPTAEDQTAIERYIENLDVKLRRYMLARQKLSKLLAEERDNITRKALEKESSQRVRIELVVDVVERPVEREADELYTTVGLYNRGRGIFHKPPLKGAELGDSDFFWLQEGDLVLSGQFAWEGAVAMAGVEDAGCVASHRYPILRGKPDVLESAYLLSFFRTVSGQLLLDHHSRGGAGRNRPLNVRTLLKEKISIPSLSAQRQIARMVDLEAQLNRAVLKEMAGLREFRARLVGDVVTGKFDVRGAVALLPSEGPDDAALDEMDDLTQDEESAEVDLEAEDAA